MAILNECNIPEDLYYDIENQVWGKKTTMEHLLLE